MSIGFEILNYKQKKTQTPAKKKPQKKSDQTVPVKRYSVLLNVEKCPDTMIDFCLSGCDDLKAGVRDSLARLISRLLESQRFTAEQMRKEIYD